MIIRRRYNRNFTVLPNAVVDDVRLSPEALGVLVYLRSRPEAWNVDLAHLGERFKIGRDKTQRVIAELVNTGWIRRERTRDAATRAFNGIEYVVYDEPVDTTDSASVSEPQPENPVVAHDTPQHRPQPEKPRTANPVVHIEETNTDLEKTTPVAPKGAVGEISKQQDEGDAEASFQAFIAAYAPSATASVVTPLRHWRKLSPEEREQAVRSIGPYKAACAKERRKVADPSTYLSRRLFMNFVARTVVRPPESAAAAALRGRKSDSWVLVELGTPEWDAWQAVAEEAGIPVRAINVPARPLAGRPHDAVGAYLPARWPPGRAGPDGRARAAGELAEAGAG